MLVFLGIYDFCGDICILNGANLRLAQDFAYTLKSVNASVKTAHINSSPAVDIRFCL